jgi:site-specific DNA recombinase
MSISEVSDKREGEVQHAADKTAVVYLRVSSPGQLTGYSAEGYSIEGQRLACERYVEQLDATVIREYVEPGKTATSLRRPTLQQMLADLPELKPTYVVFYDLSRVARDEFDAFWLLREIKHNGAKLESAMERIDDSDDGMLLYTFLTGINAHRSRRDGKKVKMGMERKFADGGTLGPARTGYKNVREVAANGREVRTIAFDEDRYRLIQLAFDAFATGEHSITTLRSWLEELGLRTRATPKRPERPLSRNGLYRILRDDYYIGIVTHKGVKREGRHPAMIDRETFAKVQQILDAHRLSGDRTQKHLHYLKGSIFCAHCGQRLLYGRHRGKAGGVYEYFSCMSHQGGRQKCGAKYMSVEAVERAIEAHYKRVYLTTAQTVRVRRHIEGQVETRLDVAKTQSEHHGRRLRILQDEQQKLVHLYYRGGVSEEVLQTEQERIEAERTQARRWIDSASYEAEGVMEALDDALAIAGLCHEVYAAAEPTLRRMMNQAIFSRLLVRFDELDGERQPVFEHLAQLAKPSVAANQGLRTAKTPVLSGALGSNDGKMVPRAGLEPAPPD